MIGSGMSTTGAGFLKAGLHGLNSGLAASLQDENFGRGFVTGAVSSGIGSFAQSPNIQMPASLMVASTTAMGGAAAWATGGSFLQGALRGMQIGAFNHGMHMDINGNRTYDVDDVEIEIPND